jgi:LCP family protein required for cell wall assembly
MRKANKIPLMIFLAVLLIALVAVAAVAIQQNRTPAAVDAQVNAGTEDEELEKWQENVISYNGKNYKYNNAIKVYLLMGIDKDGVVETAPDYVSGGQSDAMFLLVANSDDDTLSVISINRNSMTDVEVYTADGQSLGTVTAQICVQHGYGDGKKWSCTKSVDAVSHLFYNLPINGYLALNMDALSPMNDAVGGVEVTVLHDLYYPGSGVDLKEGDVVTLNGTEAYYYLRGRDTGEFDSASYRLRRQEQYITAYMAKLKETVSGNPSKITDIYESIEDYVVTNIDFASLAAELMQYEYDDSRMYTVPGETVEGGNYEEYQVDDDALYDLIIQVFYKEVEEP